jgi:hypothetical protein
MKTRSVTRGRATRLAAIAAAVTVGLLSTATVASSAHAMVTPPVKSFIFTHGTHNTLHGTAVAKPFADVIGWQEVDTKSGRAKFRNLAGYHSYIPAGAAGADPISWRTSKFKLLHKHSLMAHGGLKGVSPNRYVNDVVLQHRATGQRIVIVNTHFVSGAWKHQAPAAWRTSMWNIHLAKLRTRIAKLLPHQYPVFLGGDMNNPKRVKIAGMRMPKNLMSGPISIDQLQHSAGSAIVTYRTGRKLGSDHALKVATYQVSVRR